MARQQLSTTNLKNRKILKKYLLSVAIFHFLNRRAFIHKSAPKTAKFQPKNKWVRRLFQTSLFELIVSYFSSYNRVLRRYPLQALAIAVIFLSLFGVMNYTYAQIFKDLPDPSELINRENIVTTKIVDRNDKVLFRIYEDENRTIIPLKEMPPQVVYSTIAIEDKDFFNHHGFSIRGIVRAAIANFKNERVQGGSTLTQQLIKNRLLSTEKTYTRKIREALLAVMTEQQFSKEEILEMYLNQVAYGGSTYGIEEAAQQYFGKHARQLTLAEAALLAGLTQAPSTYSPFGGNPEMAFRRQEEVIRRMQEDGYITNQQAEDALQQPLKFRKDVIDIQAPHFVMYVKQLLAAEFGEEAVQNGGLVVRTTLDLQLQQAAQKIVSDELNTLQRLNIKNGAALITNPQTGEILSMVGSKDYFDFENDGQVNVTLRPRQPGSSIKPVTYALALENGLTPVTTIQDAPVSYRFEGAPSYSPVNYDGKYHGKVTIREALASSYNIPAVKTLNSLGVNNMIDKAEDMGITTWQDRKRFGLSLTLGGGEVLMKDMSTVYGVLANGGQRVDLNPILEVTTYKGEVLYRNECVLDGKNCQSEKVLDPGVAYQITHILSDNDARTPAFGPMSTLHIPDQEVAVKTGTTNSLRDNWTIGYTSNRVVSVWVGNNDNTPMSYVASGITGASPIWNNLMRLQLSDEQPHFFAVPSEVTKVSICTYTNKVSCSWCNSTREEVFIAGTEPKDNCRFQPPMDDIARNNQGSLPTATPTP